MKKRLCSIISAVVIILVSSFTIAYASSPNGVPLNKDLYPMQINNLMNALKEFGPISPDQAVELWGKAEKTRNGALEYMVLSDNLRKSFISQWGMPDKNFWVIGVSSPWLESYKIVGKSRINPTTDEIKLQLIYATSAGKLKPQVKSFTVSKVKDYWYITKIK